MKIKWITISAVLTAMLLVPLTFAGGGRTTSLARFNADKPVPALRYRVATPRRFGEPVRGYRLGESRVLRRGWQSGVRRPYVGPSRGYRLNAGRLARILDLTDEQTENIKAIVKEAREEITTNRKAVRKAAMELRTAMRTGDPDVAKTHSEALSVAIGELTMARTLMIQAIHEQLTEEQREQLEQTKGRMGRGHRARRGPDLMSRGTLRQRIR